MACTSRVVSRSQNHTRCGSGSARLHRARMHDRSSWKRRGRSSPAHCPLVGTLFAWNCKVRASRRACCPEFGGCLLFGCCYYTIYMETSVSTYGSVRYTVDVCYWRNSRATTRDVVHPFSRVCVCACARAVFYPHWLGVVGPTTTQPVFTITQDKFTTTNREKSAEMLHFS